MKPSASEARLRDFLDAWYDRKPAPDGWVDSEISMDTIMITYHPKKGIVHLQAPDIARVLSELAQHRLSYNVQTTEPE